VLSVSLRLRMFKFVSKGDKDSNESALFYNGQRLCTITCNVLVDDGVWITVEDGNDTVMKEWEDYLEEG
jgi:hypothetical protein